MLIRFAALSQKCRSWRDSNLNRRSTKRPKTERIMHLEAGERKFGKDPSEKRRKRNRPAREEQKKEKKKNKGKNCNMLEWKEEKEKNKNKPARKRE